MFRSPRRRQVRQRSGYHVSEETSGSETRLKEALRLTFPLGAATLRFEMDHLRVVPLFGRSLGLVAFGAFLKPTHSLQVNLMLSCQYGDDPFTNETEISIDAGVWSKIGIHTEILQVETASDVSEIIAEVRLNPDKESPWTTDVFGMILGGVTDDFLAREDVWELFNTKTHITIPEIYYIPMEDAANVFPVNLPTDRFAPGECVVLKSCNRCARFLLIDVEDERNTLCFSNHCVKRAPCTHKSFSTFSVLHNECLNPPRALSEVSRSERSQATLQGELAPVRQINVHYGYQLECKACKKFFVNAPLNPLRSPTQHREDSLRRRALEVLVDTLLERSWVYFQHRIETGTEFDTFIWDRFDKRCFKCGTDLPGPEYMDLDHTLPLSFLWPLDDSATCLCRTCNSSKGDKFPVEFYSEDELDELARITGMDEDLLRSRRVNEAAVDQLVANVEWFFDEFLSLDEYQKIRDGKRTADLILAAVQKVIAASGLNVDLVETYRNLVGSRPASVSP